MSLTIISLSVMFIIGFSLTVFCLRKHWKMEKDGQTVNDGTQSRVKFVGLSYVAGLGIVFMALSAIFLNDILTN